MTARTVARGVLTYVALLAVLALFVTFINRLWDHLDDSDDRRAAGEAFENAPAPELVVSTPTAAPPKLALTYPAGALATAETWPRACDLLSDDDVRAFLPQAENITRTGKADSTVFNVEAFDPTSRYRWIVKGQRIDMPEASCDIQFHLPHKSSFADPGPVAVLTVAVSVAGDPEIVWGYSWALFPNSEPADPQLVAAGGARACKGGPGRDITCTKGAVTFSVGAGIAAEERGIETIRVPGTSPGTDSTTAFRTLLTPRVTAHVLARIP